MRTNYRAVANLILAGVVLLALALVMFAPTALPQASSASSKRMVIAARTILDGRGNVLHNTRIVVEGSKIVAIDAKAGPVDYEIQAR